MLNVLNQAQFSENPLSALTDFLEEEKRFEVSEQYDKLRFAGYVLEIGFDSARIVTCDPYKRAVGGIPRGSFLIMVPDTLEGLPPHFTLLRVSGVAPTPLSTSVQQTYFELHKKSMPELDRWTVSELQWGSIDCDLLGMYYPSPSDSSKPAFSGDVNTIVSAHRYRVFSPNERLLELIMNGMVKPEMQQDVGSLRLTECQLPFNSVPQVKTAIKISLKDFLGARTAMFGKTRLGKSNVVKILAQSMIRATSNEKNCGQLIFDINGEYANDNPQDGNKSLRSANDSSCSVYALTPRGTYAKPLRLNFYETPDSCISILGRMMEASASLSGYVKSFASLSLPSLDDISSMSFGDKGRAYRKIQLYWAILKKAGYSANEQQVSRLLPAFGKGNASRFDPAFNTEVRAQVYNDQTLPSPPTDLDSLVRELERFADYVQDSANSELQSTSKKALFDPEDLVLLQFLKPVSSRGVKWIDPFKQFHDKDAGDVVSDIIGELNSGKTVILDLGSAEDNVRKYFSDLISKAIFRAQENKFSSNSLGNHFITLYFEEAHNLFPRTSKETTDVYSRFAKEGAKFHIGMVYSTQSPSTISQELLAQTENFFVGHVSSQDEARSLGRVNVAFDGLEQDILRAKTPGYMRMLTQSHRFVVPVQAYKFEAVSNDSQGS
ncbi:DUF87 domain-containing protein [Bacillus subtilis]|nr:DUF87 domain-containing protein [Pseudomonas sp. A29(2023)]MDL5596113.1 DUF87 domain-containing protein [Bacillus subtilis]